MITFIITPASSDPSNPTLLAWRFGIVLLIIQLIFLIIFVEPVLLAILNWLIPKKYLLSLSLLISSLPILLFFYGHRDLVRVVPEKNEILMRPYVDSTSNYLSVFDYVDANKHNSIVWVEGAQSFYAYDPKFTNSVTRKLSADYIIFVDIEEDALWIETDNWSKIYSDGKGMIFKRDQNR